MATIQNFYISPEFFSNYAEITNSLLEEIQVRFKEVSISNQFLKVIAVHNCHALLYVEKIAHHLIFAILEYFLIS